MLTLGQYLFGKHLFILMKSVKNITKSHASRIDFETLQKIIRKLISNFNLP